MRTFAKAQIEKAHFILYVQDQAASTAFYENVLAVKPTLLVPGMTEFSIGENTVLGLMPEHGIARLLGLKMEESLGAFPKGELYLQVNDPEAYHRRALAAGARIKPIVPAGLGG